MSTVQPTDEQIFNVQPMDDEMHTDLKLVKNTRPDHGRGNEEYITKTIQYMDEAKVKKLQV